MPSPSRVSPHLRHASWPSLSCSGRLELQENKKRRTAEIADSARAEAVAYREQANLLKTQYQNALSTIDELQKEIEASADPWKAFVRLFTGGK